MVKWIVINWVVKFYINLSLDNDLFVKVVNEIISNEYENDERKDVILVKWLLVVDVVENKVEKVEFVELVKEFVRMVVKEVLSND